MSRRVMYLVFVVVVLGACGASWGQTKASAPDPADGAMGVAAPLLRWTVGSTALFHDVYLGLTPELGPENLVGPRHPANVFYYMGGLQPGTTYYWRVDEIDKDGVTIYPGDVWSFTTQALTAYRPDPADGATLVPAAPVLTWLAGQGAVQHHVYFSDDRDAVSQAAASADKGLVPLADAVFTPGELQEATTYFWRVDEVLLGGAVKEGPVWSFTTWVMVDDFESYNDEEGQGTRIYETWIDGWVNNNGATVGYTEPPFAEQTIVHGGLQSMPLDYNNVVAPFYSEAEREFSPAEDWTAGGTDALVLYVRGRAVDLEIQQVSPPPVIDGQVDEAWTGVQAYPIRTRISDTDPTGPADASGQFRVLYDATNLYALVDVNDELLYNDSGSSYLDDSVEFYVDGENTKAQPPLSGNNRQYTFGWTTTDIQGTNTDVTGVEHAQVNTPTGWRIEIKLPWQSLMGSSAPVGKLIGVDCFYNDDDNGGDTRESQIAWHSRSSGDWQTPASWGTAMVAPPQSAAGADNVYVALQDSSNHTFTVAHPDAGITKAADWVEWKIPLSEFTGVDPARVKKIVIGVGDKANPVVGSAGLIFIDDICLVKP